MPEALRREPEMTEEFKTMFVPEGVETLRLNRVGEIIRENIDGQDCVILCCDEKIQLPEEHGGGTVRKVMVVPWKLFEQAKILFKDYNEFDRRNSPSEYSDKSEGFLTRIAKGIGSRVSGLALVTALGTAACDTTNHDDPTEQSSKYTTQEGKLSQLKYSYGDKIIPPWTKFEDGELTLGKAGDKDVMIFTRYVDGVGTEFFYVDCDTWEKCITVQEAKMLKGVENTGVTGGSTLPLIVNNDFYFNRGLKDQKGILYYKTGELNVGSITEIPDTVGSNNSLVYEGPTPFLYGSGGKQNLLTMDFIPFNYPYDACDLPHRPGTADGPGKWLASVPINSPNTVCWLVEADTFGAIKPGVEYFLDKVNKSTGGKNTYHPRIGEPDPVTGAEVVWFLKGNDASTTRIMAMIRTPIKANPDPQPEQEVDAGGTTETDTSTIELAVELPQNPEPDAEVATEVEATGGEIDGVLDSTTDDGDATGILDETGNGSTDIATDEATQLPDNGAQELPPQDNGPDIKETIDPCQSIASKMKMTQDKCGLENCKDLTVDLTGSCTIEVNLGGKQPMTLHIDGKFSIDMFEKMGQLLQGQYKVVDNGNNFNVAYETLVTGVTGTTYEGKEAMTDSGPNKAVEKGYYIKCNEGSIDLYLLDGKGGKTKIATLNAGEDGTFTLNGQKVVKDTDAGNDATQPTDTGNETSADANSPDTSGNDAGQDNGQNPQTDASSNPPETSTNPEPTFDAGQSGQETSQPEQPQATQPETTTSQPSSSPPKDGCSISTTSPTSPESQNSAFAQLGILLSATALLLRRKIGKSS